MSNQSEFPTIKAEITLRVRFKIKPRTNELLRRDCDLEKRKPHDQVAWIVEKFYEGKNNG